MRPRPLRARRRLRRRRRVGWPAAVLLGGTLLTACAGAPPAEPAAAPDAMPQEEPTDGFASPGDEIRYYLGRLSDREFTETYGGEEHPRTWYTAAEELGRIGAPAIPHLVPYLDSADPWELKLALYALMLASQDPAVTEQTGGDYVRLGTVLEARHNAENRAIARAWWERWRHLWDQGSAE